MKHFILAITLSLFAAAAIAAPVTYRLDSRHTVVLVSWSHFGFSHPTANFGQAEGGIVYDADNVGVSSVEATLPLSGLDAFVPALNEHLRSVEFFDAAKYPDITFRSTNVEAAGKGSLKVIGNLTIKNVTRPVTLDVTLNKAAEQPMSQQQAIGFDARATIKRSDFGVDKYAPGVSDEVELRITTEALVPKPDAAK